LLGVDCQIHAWLADLSIRQEQHGKQLLRYCVFSIMGRSMLTLLYTLLAVLMGATIAIYLSMNAVIAKYFGSPITANVSFFVVALLTALLIFILFGDVRTLGKFRTIPAYLFMTGVASACMVLGTTFFIPRLGARKVFILLLAGQVVAAMIVSHWGILESPQDPITLRKVAGAILLIVGAIISTT
jgi:transporter family-2 protein